jgi:hypothetical protein
LLKKIDGKYQELWETQTQGHVSITPEEMKGSEVDESESLIDITSDEETQATATGRS